MTKSNSTKPHAVPKPNPNDHSPVCLGIDVGGANIKLANNSGWSCSEPFPMWLEHRQLSKRLASLLVSAPRFDTIAATMTGELADCFSNKTEGVVHIVESLRSALKYIGFQGMTFVYSINGFIPLDNDKVSSRPNVFSLIGLEKANSNSEVLTIAAANWHAIGNFVSKLGHNGLAIDCGSTTTDITRVHNGKVDWVTEHDGLPTDTNRIAQSWLVYTGVRRSYLAGIAQQVNFRGRQMRIANELFATIEDVHIALGNLDESASVSTADGRPKRHKDCVRRLGKMICADDLEFSPTDAQEIASQFEKAQIATIVQSVLQVDDDPLNFCWISGDGEFLIQKALNQIRKSNPGISLPKIASKEFSKGISDAFAAFSVAKLLELKIQEPHETGQ